MFLVLRVQSRRKTREPKEENVTLGPTVREGEYVFGVAHIFASFNDTFIVSVLVASLALVVLVVLVIETVFGFILTACHGSVREGDAGPHHW